jgi:hypothetical protein
MRTSLHSEAPESLLCAPASAKIEHITCRRANHRVARIGASDIRDSNNDADAGGSDCAKQS